MSEISDAALTKMIDQYCASWGEDDPARRAALLQEVWAERATYTDPLAHVEDARAYKERFAERVTVVVIARASHAVIAEQPDAVSAALISYARGLWPDEAAK